MSAADVPLRYRRIRAPREDGAALIDPPVAEAFKLVEANRKLAETWEGVSGARFSKWRTDARMLLLTQIAGRDDRNWTVEELRSMLARPWVLSGHQPSLFHPGVWFKNFLIDWIAKDVEALAVNLIVDSDTVRHAGIRVPTGTPRSPRVIDVPLDAPAPELPWEERFVLDPGQFRSFASRVRVAFDPIRPPQSRGEPMLIDSVWQRAIDYFDRPVHPSFAGSPYERWLKSLGRCLAHGRHAVERSVGLDTLEAAVSETDMGDFLKHLLARWQELHPVYNAALREYRTVNHIRSRNHPVPDLLADGEWLEAPLWFWDVASPQRRKAFVRPYQHSFELSDRQGIRISPLGRDIRDQRDLVPGEMVSWITSGCVAAVRPRALITTMFARLILSDLFIHGIGGAKYDELTDVLIRRFFGIEPPAYMTATATFRLPIERPSVTADDVRALEQRIRDTVHHPESFAGQLGGNRAREFAQLAEQKSELIAAGWQEKQKKAWHDRVTECNDRMTALLGDVRQRFVQKREKLLADLHAANLLGSREFSFVLFPEETLPRQLLDLCAARP
jgi:hypothetical protein